MTRRLCTEYVDPRRIEAIPANRLIPLDKGEGKVRPIGVGEVIRRIIRKCVMSVTKQDVIDACGSLQVCAGHKSGSEATVHAMHNMSRPLKAKRAVITEKGASSWSSVIPFKEMNFTLNKRKYRDAIKLRYGWEFNDIPTGCVCGDLFDADHEILQVVCTDVEMEPVLQEVTGGVLLRGTNKAPDARLDIRARGFWAREQSAFVDGRICHPNADSYKNLTSEQIYKLHENDKKRLYSSRVLEVGRGTFTPLVFTTTGGISDECQRYHSRLAELLAVRKEENYASTITWTRTQVLFAIHLRKPRGY